MKIVLDTVLKSRANVDVGPFDSEYFDKYGCVDIIGRQEDKVWEMAVRKLKKAEVEVG